MQKTPCKKSRDAVPVSATGCPGRYTTDLIHITVTAATHAATHHRSCKTTEGALFSNLVHHTILHAVSPLYRQYCICTYVHIRIYSFEKRYFCDKKTKIPAHPSTYKIISVTHLITVQSIQIFVEPQSIHNHPHVSTMCRKPSYI
jgi:hypothetical protein